MSNIGKFFRNPLTGKYIRVLPLLYPRGAAIIVDVAIEAGKDIEPIETLENKFLINLYLEKQFLINLN